MANSSGITGLEQFNQLMRQLQEMGRSIDHKTIEKALRAGSKILKDEVINHPNIPVSALDKKHAKDDIRIKKVDEELFEVGYPASGRSYYLYFYEVGTRAGTYVGDDGKFYDMPNISARPFMRPAFENSKDRIEKEIVKIVRKGMGL